MTRIRVSLMAAAVGAVIIGGLATPASAATVTVPNGLTTTDLAAPGMSAALLAADLAGPGVTVSNVVYRGAPAQAGRIHASDPAVVSFNDGVIMSSGDIANVVGPNTSDGITGDMAGPADADLTALIANTQTVNPMTYDAASLEFDFVPTTSRVYFTYTFGSDEYLEWVNLFNDVFAFYVNGTNCATVPSGEPVSIDTINDAVNPDLFRDNSYSAPPANPINIESDGLSVEMICSATVNQGKTNHMKLAIADTSDQILDSVVMLKSHSLSVTKPESCNDGVDNDDDTRVDMDDDSCATSTTPPPAGSSGVGSAGQAPPFTGVEGTPVVLDASALAWQPTEETITTTWQVAGINGTTGTCEVSPSGPQPLAGSAIAPVTAICPNDGEYVARVDGWDAEHKSSFDYDVDFFVHNAPPAVAIDAPVAGTEIRAGQALAVSASVDDPGVSDSVTCAINWGDGTSSAGILSGGVCSGKHSYAAAGERIVSVTATDSGGDSSAAATKVTVLAPATVPTAPTAPTAVPGSTVATVSWVASDNGGAAIDRYQVDVAPAAGGAFVPAAGCTGTNLALKCKANGLVNGTGYVFRVRAHNGLGWGEYSPVSAAVVPATKPGPPVEVAAAPTGAAGALAATWTVPASDGGVAIDKYIARAYLNGTTASKYCYAVTPAGCTIVGLPAGNYTVKVQAHNALGWGVASTASTTQVVATKPGAPVNVVAQRTGVAGALLATWTVPASDGGVAIDKYIARAYLNGTTASKYCYAATPAGCTIVGLPAGSYTVKVQAHNAFGWSAVSAPSVLVP